MIFLEAFKVNFSECLVGCNTRNSIFCLFSSKILEAVCAIRNSKLQHLKRKIKIVLCHKQVYLEILHRILVWLWMKVEPLVTLSFPQIQNDNAFRLSNKVWICIKMLNIQSQTLTCIWFPFNLTNINLNLVSFFDQNTNMNKKKLSCWPISPRNGLEPNFLELQDSSI